MIGALRPPEWVDWLLVLGAFWLPAAILWVYLSLREVRRLREWRRRALEEAEASAAEGYPPPDPPTTDQPPENGVR